jgi:hypothetical protein
VPVEEQQQLSVEELTSQLRAREQELETVQKQVRPMVFLWYSYGVSWVTHYFWK